MSASETGVVAACHNQHRNFPPSIPPLAQRKSPFLFKVHPDRVCLRLRQRLRLRLVSGANWQLAVAGPKNNPQATTSSAEKRASEKETWEGEKKKITQTNSTSPFCANPAARHIPHSESLHALSSSLALARAHTPTPLHNIRHGILFCPVLPVTACDFRLLASFPFFDPTWGALHNLPRRRSDANGTKRTAALRSSTTCGDFSVACSASLVIPSRVAEEETHQNQIQGPLPRHFLA